MKTEIRQCSFCSKTFDAPLKEVQRGNAKFCSLSCSSKNRINTKKKPKPFNCTCAYCNVNFFRNKSKFKNSKHGVYFCSRICKDKGQRIGGISQIQPQHYGNGIFVDYRKIVLKSRLHECEKCGYKDVPAVLEVHHKDRNRLNNTLENLELLCPTCHRVKHFLLRGCSDKS